MNQTIINIVIGIILLIVFILCIISLTKSTNSSNQVFSGVSWKELLPGGKYNSDLKQGKIVFGNTTGSDMSVLPLIGFMDPKTRDIQGYFISKNGINCWNATKGQGC